MRHARSGAVALELIAALSSCAYYNAMWSAERFAKEARRLEAQGRQLEARGQWARAAVKAESVMARHPRSRWADDALVLRGEGLARAGTCDIAAAPIAKARATVSEASLRERAGLAAAQCALAAGKPVDAEQALVDALASDDAGRRSRAAYLAGQAAAARLDYDGAIALLARSRERGAWVARARALLAAGRPAEAAAVFDTAASGMSETERVELLAGLGEAASPALDRLLAHGGRRVPFAERARLLIADGDRRLARGDYEGAAARYREAQAAAPAADEAGVAQVRAQRVLAVRAVRRSDLGPVMAELTRLTRPVGGVGTAGAVPAARSFLDLLSHIASTPETPGASFRAAELARDSLHAPLLAGQLFLDIAAADSGSLYAPKALVAALALLPARSDSIMRVLDGPYAGSPYTRVLHGEANPAYAAAEDSLARELGVQVVRAMPAALGAVRGEVPLTGPRGPWLETPAERRSVAQPPPAPPVARPRPGEPRPAAATPDRPVVPERP